MLWWSRDGGDLGDSKQLLDFPGLSSNIDSCEYSAKPTAGCLLIRRIPFVNGPLFKGPCGMLPASFAYAQIFGCAVAYCLTQSRACFR